MGFKAQTKAGILLDWLRAIQVITDECTLITSEQNVMEVWAVDPTNALMISMRMDHVWESLTTDDAPVGINIDSLIAVIEMFHPEESIAISAGCERLKKMIRVAGTSAVIGLEVIYPVDTRKPPKDMVAEDRPVRFTIDIALLQRMVKMAELVNDNLTIEADADGSVLVWTVTDHGYYQETIPTDKVLQITMVGNSVRSIFSLDYLKRVVGVMQGDVTVLLGHDAAIQLSCVLHGASVVFTLAPRIE